LSSFRVKRRWCNRERYSLRGWLFLGSRLWWCLNRLKGDFLSACRVTSPDEPPPVIISHRVHVEEFGFEGFEILVIQAEPYLEGGIRYSSLSFQEGDNLFEDVVECHVSASINASSCTIEQ